MKKRYLWLLIPLVIILAYQLFLKPLLPTVNGYAAKNLCSCVFVAGLDEERVRSEDLGFFPISLASARVNYETRSSSASLMGLGKREAIYRPGLGCVLINELDKSEWSGQSFQCEYTPSDTLLNWFELIDSVAVLDERQQGKLEDAVERAFIEDDPEKQKNTRAVVVLHRGHLVAEKYANGITKDSRLLGWSMTKSLTSTMAGLLVRDEKWSLDTPLPIEDWKGTSKEGITLKHALQMNTGLHFTEQYGKKSTANTMLWESDSMGDYSWNQVLEHEPGKVWYYSSGTTNIIAAVMKEYFESDDAYLTYLHREVFEKIGAYSFFIEPDASGAFVGSSFGWATARDWARAGQLYLNDGSWNGEQILPKEWVDFVQVPVEGSDHSYGGQFWLSGRYPGLPADAYMMSGFHGQVVMIIPSQDLVIVRLGLTYKTGDFDFVEFINDIVTAIGD